MYLKGLMSDQKRKSVEPIALQFARGPDGAAATQNEVVALQGFLTHSPWEAGDVFAGDSSGLRGRVGAHAPRSGRWARWA